MFDALGLMFAVFRGTGAGSAPLNMPLSENVDNSQRRHAVDARKQNLQFSSKTRFKLECVDRLDSGVCHRPWPATDENHRCLKTLICK